MTDISIIIPTKDELNVKNIIEDIKTQFKGYDYEIIIIDKSSDKNKKIIRSLDAKFFDQMDSGYENGVMEGFKRASGNILASIDADGTYSVLDLKKIIDFIKENNFGFVSGDRSSYLKKNKNYISFGNHFLTSLFNLLYHQKMHDVLNGIFAIKKEVFEKIKYENVFRAGTLFFEIETIRVGYSIYDIPIKYADRINTKSRITKAKPIYGVFIAFNSIRYTRDYNPLLIFGGIGLILIILGIITGIFVVANYIATGVFIEIGRGLISFMLIVLGFLSIITGLILDLLLQIERRLFRI